MITMKRSKDRAPFFPWDAFAVLMPFVAVLGTTFVLSEWAF